jgi:purine-cytosine permease-like protein
MRRSFSIAAFFVLAVLLWWVYTSTRLPPGVETKGPSDWIPWVSLAGSIVSLITGLITLALKIIEVRQKKA